MRAAATAAATRWARGFATSQQQQQRTTSASRIWEARSQQILTAAFVLTGLATLVVKSRETPSTHERHDPQAELHAPPPSDASTRMTARMATAVGAPLDDAEKDTVFDNARIAAGPVGDLLPAGRRAKEREAAAASAGADADKMASEAVSGKGTPPAIPRAALDKGPWPAAARAESDEASPVKKRSG